jgi:D-beta-D-heptose 7-phosphate kinase/D-beta-D-heptose 1-phosphate adenosyltransferase
MDIQPQKKFKILVVGDACLDVYYFGSCERLSPEAPVPIFKRKTVETRKGMCLNVAANISSLGNDVIIDSNKEVIRKIRLVDSKAGHHLLRVDEDSEIKNIDARKFTKKYMSQFDALVISDYNKGYILYQDISKIVESARFLDIPVFVDTKKKDLSEFRDCFIKINEKEFKKTSNLPAKCNLIVTLGEKGCKWRGKLYPSKKVEVHDVCGAGDVFLAGLVHMYLESNGDTEKSIRFANRCAAISVQNFGTYIIKRGDIDGK